MKKLLICLMFLAGCVGSDVPRNPMKSDKPEVKLWWQTTTAGVKKADNPWEKFVHPNPLPNRLDPWANDDLSAYSVNPVLTSSVTSSVEAPRIYFLRIRAKEQVRKKREKGVKVEREKDTKEDTLRRWLEENFEGERLQKELELLHRREF